MSRKWPEYLRYLILILLALLRDFSRSSSC